MGISEGIKVESCLDAGVAPGGDARLGQTSSNQARTVVILPERATITQWSPGMKPMVVTV
jgi:hypothetical protein